MGILLFTRKYVDELKYPLGNGSTNPIFGTIDGVPYAIKTFNNEQGNKTLINELVAYILIKKLELEIPECALAYIDKNTHIDNNVHDNEWFTDDCYGLAFCSRYEARVTVLSSAKMVKLAENAKFLIPKLILLDHLIYNKDRNKGNILITTCKKCKKLLLIDHTHIFNLETLWDSISLKQKIEDEDFKDDWIMRKNSYLYSKFLEAFPVTIVDMKEAVSYFKERLSVDFFHTIKQHIPIEWESDSQEIDALIEYIIYRFEHIDYYENLVLSNNYKEMI